MIQVVAQGAVVGLVVVAAVPGRPRPRSFGVMAIRSHRRLGPPRWAEHAVAVAVVLGAVLLFGPLALVAGVGAWFGVSPLVRRAADRRHRRAVASALPELIDLFTIAASAGHPVPAALTSVGGRAPAVVRPLVIDATVRFERGIPLAESLDQLAVGLGPGGRDLVQALHQSSSSGAALAPLLDAAARTARDTRRRESQAAARRLPVTMLLPLAMCVLPAAIVLAVVPVLLVSIASLAP